MLPKNGSFQSILNVKLLNLFLLCLESMVPKMMMWPLGFCLTLQCATLVFGGVERGVGAKRARARIFLDQWKQVCFQQTQSKGLRQLFLTVSWAELYKVKSSKKVQMGWHATKVKSSPLSSRTRCREMGILNFSWASTHLNFFWTSLTLYSSESGYQQ